MSQWSTLNKGVTALVKEAVELQIEDLLEKYQDTLKLQQKGKTQLAKEKYEELVAKDLIKKEPKTKKKAGSGNPQVDHVEESPLSTLRFLVFKNYASVLKDEFVLDPQNEELATKAINYYLQAVKIDPSDHSLWYYTGYLSQTVNKLRFARLAYETGFYTTSNQRILKLPSIQPDDLEKIISENKYTPMQWKCLEGLCQVLFDIGDYRLCRFYINEALNIYPTWEVGNGIMRKMEQKETPDSSKDAENTTNMDVCQPDPVHINLEKPDWLILMKSLLQEYKRVTLADKSKGKDQNNNEASFISRSIQISVEEPIVVEEVQELPLPKENNDLQPTKVQEGGEVKIPVEACNPTAMSENTVTTVDTEKSNASGADVNMETTENGNHIPAKRKHEDEEQEEGGETQKKDTSEQENSDNEEEDEAEEKRQSLRASKRRRDKIANEETSRLKMLDEEKAFSEKIQSFYDKVKPLPLLSRGDMPWYQISQDSMSLFWEWFDSKISELDSRYAWGIEGGKKSILLDGKETGKQSLTLFTRSPNEINPTDDSKNELKAFVTDINIQNSGVVGTLCRLIFTLIDIDVHDDKSNKRIIDNESLQLVIEIISTFELNIVDDLISNDSLTAIEKLKIILRISEYYMDKLIRTLMTTDDEAASTVQNKRRLAPSTLKLARKKEIDGLIEHTQFWVNLVSHNLFTLSIEKFNSCINEYITSDCTPVVNKSAEEELEIELRYCALKGKLEQCQNNIVDAYSWFEKCQSLLDNSKEEIHIDLGSMYDSFISKDGFEKKLNLLQIGKLYVAAKEKMNASDFEGVISDLEDIFKPKMADMDQIVESEEDFQMINILSTAYFKVKRYVDAWNCYMRLISCFARKLISYGEEQMQLEKRPSKNDDVEFFSIMSHISDIMNSLVSLTQEGNCEEWLSKDVDRELTNSLIVLIRMSTYYIFRHPDFVPLVNNFTSPDIPPHAPSKATKSNGFNDLMIKSWVLYSYLLQNALSTVQDTSAGDIMQSWSQLLQELHDELGEREICGASNSLFIHHLLNTLVKVDNVAFRRAIYQCYHCLYGVHLAAESDLIEEHHCSHGKLDQKAAEPLFLLVVDQAIEKLKSGNLLKNDLKDVVETVSDLFEEMRTDDNTINSNLTVLENYLNSDISIHSSFDKMLRSTIIPAREVDQKKSGVSSVYFKIFWMRGKTLRLQIKNRAKLNNEKNMMDLEKAIEEFHSHLALNPNDSDAWLELGACYQLLAEEELNWSASNIGAHKDLICEYQRKSFRSYLRGLHLHYLPSKKIDKYDLFFNFGNLLYSIASSPMAMEAFKPTEVRKILGADKKLVEVQNQLPRPKMAYKLATIMYSRALKDIVDKSEWRCHYMTGKCFSKINRPPMEVYNWCLQAIKRARSKNNKQEMALEPIYIFCSFLAKDLYHGRLEPKTVEQLLANEKEISTKKTDATSDDEVIYVGSSMDMMNSYDTQSPNNQVLKELNQYTGHLPAETARAYNGIFQRITDIRTADTKGWHHRPVYRIAWMYYYVYRNVDRAKSELLKLFTLRPTIKNHVNIWRPGFELPGKHYEYINKYTLFLIELSKESRDTNTLKHLYRKLRRAQTLLINDKDVFRLAYTSYLKIINDDLIRLHRAEEIMDTIKHLRLETEKFEGKCSAFIKSVSENKSLVEHSLYTVLQDLAELRKLTQGYILPADVDEDGLNDVIQKCFAVVMFGGFQGNIKLHALQHAADADVNMTDASEKEDVLGRRLLEVLLAQAKVLMQNITASSR